MNNKAVLTEGPIRQLLVKLTVPMFFGLLGMMAFNLADTYFVGQLGTLELAAMAFTFPVVMVISSLALGLGMGASALVSRAIGEQDRVKMKRLTTDSLLLSVLIVALSVIAGLFTIEPLFRMLGASEKIVSIVKKYMSIWYPGMIAVVVPMVGNNAIRATGDTKTPSIIMLVSVVINIVLDPLLIFGIGPFPRLEIAGAALATVIARMVTLIFAFWVLVYRERMLTFRLPSLKVVFKSWKDILHIGVPAAGTNMLLPVSAGIITRLVAQYGHESVAGFGVATRIEMFSLTLVVALSSVLSPFIGQNLGANKYRRIKSGLVIGQQFSLIWGAVLFVALIFLGRPVASLFNSDPLVIETAVSYFWIAPIGYGALGVLRISTIALNVLHKPVHSTVLMLIQTFGLYVPLSFLGSGLFGLNGIFIAAVISYCITACIAYYYLRTLVTVEQESFCTQRCQTDTA